MSALCNTSVKLTSILPIAYDGEVLLRSLVKQVSTENDSALAHRFPLLVGHMEKLSHVSYLLIFRLCRLGNVLLMSFYLSLPLNVNSLEIPKGLRDVCVTALDGGEPDGHDQFPGSSGEDVGDCGAASAEEFEEGSGAVLSSPGVQYLWAAGLHRLGAHCISHGL